MYKTTKTAATVSTYSTILVCTLVNGTAKYMADADSFDRCTYEAMNSPWNRGAAEKLAEEGMRLLLSQPHIPAGTAC